MCLLLFFRDKPAEAPSVSATAKRQELREGFVALMKHKHFWLLSLAYGIGTGVYAGAISLCSLTHPRWICFWAHRHTHSLQHTHRHTDTLTHKTQHTDTHTKHTQNTHTKHTHKTHTNTLSHTLTQTHTHIHSHTLSHRYTHTPRDTEPCL